MEEQNEVYFNIYFPFQLGMVNMFSKDKVDEELLVEIKKEKKKKEKSKKKSKKKDKSEKKTKE